MLGTTNDDSELKCTSVFLKREKKKMTAAAVEANRWRQAGRTVAAESDDITPIGRL